MGLGIVEPKRQGTHVPATAVLLQDDLTRTKAKDEIVLVPRPSNSLRDPLVGAFSQFHASVGSHLTFLTELAIVEERSLSLCHMPLNHRRWYSKCHIANSQWDSTTGIQDLDHKS